MSTHTKRRKEWQVFITDCDKLKHAVSLSFVYFILELLLASLDPEVLNNLPAIV